MNMMQSHPLTREVAFKEQAILDRLGFESLCQMRAFWKAARSKWKCAEDRIKALAEELGTHEHYEDESFDYEYGSISATHHCGHWEVVDAPHGEEIEFYDISLTPHHPDDLDPEAYSDGEWATLFFESADYLSYNIKDARLLSHTLEEFEYRYYDERTHEFRTATKKVHVVKYVGTVNLMEQDD